MTPIAAAIPLYVVGAWICFTQARPIARFCCGSSIQSESGLIMNIGWLLPILLLLIWRTALGFNWWEDILFGLLLVAITTIDLTEELIPYLFSGGLMVLGCLSGKTQLTALTVLLALFIVGSIYLSCFVLKLFTGRTGALFGGGDAVFIIGLAPWFTISEYIDGIWLSFFLLCLVIGIRAISPSSKPGDRVRAAPFFIYGFLVPQLAHHYFHFQLIFYPTK